MTTLTRRPWLLLPLLFFMSTVGVYAQSQSFIRKGVVLVGSSTGGSGALWRDPVTNERNYFLTTVFHPRVGVLFSDRWMVAGQIEFETRTTSDNSGIGESYWGYGGLIRHYPAYPSWMPMSENHIEEPGSPKPAKRLRCFLELGGHHLPAFSDNLGNIAQPNLRTWEIQAGFGGNLRLWKGLCLELGWFYVARPFSEFNSSPLRPRIGLEWFIQPSKK